MRRILAGLLTVVMMALLIWAGARRTQPPGATDPVGPSAAPRDEVATSTAPPAHPAESCVQALMESARQGDVAAYLDAFTGDLRKRLDREIAERGRGAFADDLGTAARSRKSHAVFSAETEGADAALVTVEAVYPDRNERQTYRIEKTGDRWLVVGVETVRSVQPKAKYGSMATFEAPEGVPVQGDGGVTVETGEEPEPDPMTGQVPR
jgi:hypothetical protein